VNSTNVTARLSPAYWRLWTASTISNLGDGVFLVALPLLAARLTRSELSIAFMTVAATLPWLLISLPVGALVDRIDHRLLLVRADLFRAVIVGGLAVAAATDNISIWMLWLAAGLLGVGEVFFDNASQAIVPTVVPAELLERANGWRYSAEVTANSFIGTPIGGVLLMVAVWLPFGFDAVSFAVAAILVAGLRPMAGAPRHKPTSRRIGGEVREGLRWLFGQRVLRGLAIAAGLAVIGMHMIGAIFVLFAQDLLHLSDRWYGALIAIGAVGYIVGGLVAERVINAIGTLATVYSVMLLWAVSMFAEGMWPRLWVSVIATVSMAFATTVWNTATVSLRQRVVPAHLFGRVNSVYRWLVWGSLSIGAALGGIIAHGFGLRAPFFVGTAFSLLGLLTLSSSVTRASLAELGSRPLQAAPDDTPTSLDIELW
jgi:MFS family permease